MSSFHQLVTVNDFNDIDRFDLYTQLTAGKDVLHIGCADWPFVPEHNLHLHLSKICNRLYGVDTHAEGLQCLIEHGIDGTTLAPHLRYEKVDVVLVPEVIEHVMDVKGFLSELTKIDADRYVITAPCAMQCAMRGHFSRTKNTVLEIVHPDHKCWYSPYTLANLLKEFFTIEYMFWNNGISIGAVCLKK